MGNKCACPTSWKDPGVVVEAPIAAPPEARSQPGESVELLITDSSGPVCSLVAQRNWTVRRVKEAIEREARVPASEQRLVFQQVKAGSEQGDELADAVQLTWLREVPTVDVTLIRLSKLEAEWVRKILDCRPVTSIGKMLSEAPEKVRGNELIMETACCLDGRALAHGTADIKANRRVVTTAVCQCGWAIAEASKDLKAQRSIALLAVRRNGRAVRELPKELREDKEILLVAVRSNRRAFKYVPAELRRDPDLLKAKKESRLSDSSD